MDFKDFINSKSLGNEAKDMIAEIAPSSWDDLANTILGAEYDEAGIVFGLAYPLMDNPSPELASAFASALVAKDEFEKKLRTLSLTIVSEGRK